jgi:hypothetical protein
VAQKPKELAYRAAVVAREGPQLHVQRPRVGPRAVHQLRHAVVLEPLQARLEEQALLQARVAQHLRQARAAGIALAARVTAQTARLAAAGAAAAAAGGAVGCRRRLGSRGRVSWADTAGERRGREASAGEAEPRWP